MAIDWNSFDSSILLSFFIFSFDKKTRRFSTHYSSILEHQRFSPANYHRFFGRRVRRTAILRHSLFKLSRLSRWIGIWFSNRRSTEEQATRKAKEFSSFFSTWISLMQTMSTEQQPHYSNTHVPSAPFYPPQGKIPRRENESMIIARLDPMIRNQMGYPQQQQRVQVSFDRSTRSASGNEVRSQYVAQPIHNSYPQMYYPPQPYLSNGSIMIGNQRFSVSVNWSRTPSITIRLGLGTNYYPNTEWNGRCSGSSSCVHQSLCSCWLRIHAARKPVQRTRISYVDILEWNINEKVIHSLEYSAASATIPMHSQAAQPGVQMSSTMGQQPGMQQVRIVFPSIGGENVPFPSI